MCYCVTVYIYVCVYMCVCFSVCVFVCVCVERGQKVLDIPLKSHNDPCKTNR